MQSDDKTNLSEWWTNGYCGDPETRSAPEPTVDPSAPPKAAGGDVARDAANKISECSLYQTSQGVVLDLDEAAEIIQQAIDAARAPLVEKIRRLKNRENMPCVEAALHADNAALRDRVAELEASFDLRWKADMRAIEAWQKETVKELVWPDHADLCVWLLDQLAAARVALEFYNDLGKKAREALEENTGPEVDYVSSLEQQIVELECANRHAKQQLDAAHADCAALRLAAKELWEPTCLGCGQRHGHSHLHHCTLWDWGNRYGQWFDTDHLGQQLLDRLAKAEAFAGRVAAADSNPTLTRFYTVIDEARTLIGKENQQ